MMAPVRAMATQHNPEAITEKVFFDIEIGGNKAGVCVLGAPLLLYRPGRVPGSLAVCAKGKACSHFGGLGCIKGCDAPQLLLLQNTRDAHPMDVCACVRACLLLQGVLSSGCMATMCQRLPR